MFGRRPEEKRTEGNRKVLWIMPISVGQKYHEGAEFDKAIERANQESDFCLIVPVNELHAHTAMIENPDITREEAIEKTKNEGYAWKQRTTAELESRKTKAKKQGQTAFKKPYEMSDWEEWTGTDHYRSSSEYLTNVYNDPTGVINPESENFQSLVGDIASGFVASFSQHRKKKNPLNKNLVRFNVVEATQHTIDYLLEEIAFVDMLKDGHLPPRIADLVSEALQTEEYDICIAYPFGHNSTNKSVYECFQEFKSDRLSFYNLSEKKSPSSKATGTLEKIKGSNTKLNDSFYIDSADLTKNLDDFKSLIPPTDESRVNTPVSMHFLGLKKIDSKTNLLSSNSPTAKTRNLGYSSPTAK